MEIGQKYYCRQVIRGKINVEISYIKAICENRKWAILDNDREIDIITGREKNTKLFWKPFNEDEKLISASLISKAKKWFKKMLSNDDIMVNMYQNLVKQTDIDTKHYYHLLTQEAKDILINVRISFLKKYYKQPNWCYNYNALNGCLGCKYLLGGKIKKQTNCLFCPYYLQPQLQNYNRLRLIAGLSIRFCNNLLGISDYGLIESGERPATQQELAIMEMMFNTNNWTLEQVLTYFRTTNSGKTIATDVVYREFGELINNNINTIKLKNEKKNIQFTSR